MAKILGVTVAELIGETKTRHAPPAGGRLGQLFEAASKLPRHRQQKIVEVLELLVKNTRTDTPQCVIAANRSLSEVNFSVGYVAAKALPSPRSGLPKSPPQREDCGKIFLPMMQASLSELVWSGALTSSPMAKP